MKKIPPRVVRWILILLVVQWAAGLGLARLARRNLLRVLPEGTQVGTVQWRWPIGIRVHDLVLPDPAAERPFLLKVQQADFGIPVWLAWVRPIPVRMVLRSPHVQLHTGNLYPVIQGIGLPSQLWLPVPMWEMEKPEGPPFPYAPVSLEILNGRLDAFAEQIQAGRPAFSAAHVNLKVGLSVQGREPVLTLSGSGHFVSETDQIIGMHSMSATLNPQKRRGTGFLRLRHERLGDFQKIYEYAPRPIWIDSGTADVVLMGEITDGKHLRLTARCLVENLDMRGEVGSVSWGQIMNAVEDEGRRYEWVVHTEGEIDDPKFNPHDQILREVEFFMKEKAASQGLKIDGQMFFYADTPGSVGPLRSEKQ